MALQTSAGINKSHTGVIYSALNAIFSQFSTNGALKKDISKGTVPAW
jgi:hypothetical protein